MSNEEEYGDETQLEKYCPRCDRFRPNSFEQTLRSLMIANALDFGQREPTHCIDCGGELTERPITEKKHYRDCECGQTTPVMNRHCMYCGRRNRDYFEADLCLARCPSCDTDKGPDDLIQEYRQYLNFCARCGDEMLRILIPRILCSDCGNGMKPWQLYCEQCGTQNARCKPPSEVLRIFHADS